MYPLIRMLSTLFRARRQPPLGPFDTHVSQHICWPWDLDPWFELNNGRTLTLYDLGRIALGIRMGAAREMQRMGLVVAVAGTSIRYRSRIRAFERFEMRSRLLGWDARFLYVEQSMWRGETCCSNVLLRKALTRGTVAGIVPPAELAGVLGLPEQSPELPDWVQAWIAAEGQRPWPPQP